MRDKQALKSERMLRTDHSIRHRSGTTHPTVDVTHPKIFKDAVKPVQELRVGTPPEYYWFSEELAEVTDDKAKEATERSRSRLMQLYQKHPPVHWTN